MSSDSSDSLDQLKPRATFSNQPHGTSITVECPERTWEKGEGLHIPSAKLNGNFIVTANAYYDKNQNSDQDFQWILLKQNFSVGSSGLVRNDHEGKGWAVVGVDLKHYAPQELIYDQSSPGNVNGQTQYSTSWNFNIGAFGITPTGGAGISGSESHAIQDWNAIFNQVDTHSLSWTFAQANPCDSNLKPERWPEEWLRVGKGFEIEVPHLKVKDFSAISANGISGFSVSSTWKTSEVLKSTLIFKFEMDILCAFLAEHTTALDDWLLNSPLGNIRYALEHLANNQDGSFMEARVQAIGPGPIMALWTIKQSVSYSLLVDLSRVV